MKPLVGLAVLLVTLAGCATVNSQASALVEYRRSGGITGREDRLVISADGTARLTRGAGVTAFTLAGGGDTVAAINAFGIDDRVGYVSTAGGAFLEFLEGKKLPAVEALEARYAE